MAQAADKQLAVILKKLNKIATGDARIAIAKKLAAEAVTQVALGFRGTRDPYGTPWPAAMYRAGRVLRDSGRLANSFSAQGVNADGFRLGTNVRYAATHQHGAVIVPKKAKLLRFPVPIAGPTARAAGRGPRGGLGHMFAFAKKVTIPQRMMVPVKARGLGDIWTKAFNAAARLALRSIAPKAT